jgi:hypothetical protein
VKHVYLLICLQSGLFLNKCRLGYLGQLDVSTEIGNCIKLSRFFGMKQIDGMYYLLHPN